MKICRVSFGLDCSTQVGAKKYSYFTDIKDLKEGEEVVVETRYGTQIAVFMGYVEPNTVAADKATSWIIQKVDFSKVYERKIKLDRLQEIRKIFMEKKAVFEERHMFEIIANTNDDMYALLKEYDKLIG